MFVFTLAAGTGYKTSAPSAVPSDTGGSDGARSADASSSTSTSAHFPLVRVADVDLPGNATRFDYQDIDAARGHLVVAHMNDAEVLILNLSDGSVAKRLPNVPVARGVAVAEDAQRIFVTSSPNRAEPVRRPLPGAVGPATDRTSGANQLVIIDGASLNEIGRVPTGSGPDGVGWDPVHKIVGVSDQHDGAVSLIGGAGTGARTQVPLGTETGNVVHW